jgi:transposase
MEASGSAHHWGRELQGFGHEVRLLPPSDVARYRDGNKTDRADAIAILEAGRNEAIDPVPVKTLEQQALTSLHRLRSAYVADRTARINTVRGDPARVRPRDPPGLAHVRRPRAPGAR